MYANKYLAIVLALVAGQSMAQDTIRLIQPATPTAVPTVGQLAEQARQKRLLEDTIRTSASTTNSLANPVGSIPNNMVIVPSSQIITGAALAQGTSAKGAPNEKKVLEKKTPPPEFIPVVLGTYKRDGEHFVELGEMAGNERFAAGQVTPSGWTVMTISAKAVQLGKIDPKSGAIKRITLQVSGM